MESPFECDYCGIEFGQYKELRDHKSLHSNRVHFQCLKCEYIGKTTKLLKQHMRKHVTHISYQRSSNYWNLSNNLYSNTDEAEPVR